MPRDQSWPSLTAEGELRAAVSCHDDLVVAFRADWCRRCRDVERALAAVDVPVATVDVDAAPMIAHEYGVDRLPTLVRFADGAPVDRIVGVPTDLKDALREPVQATTE